MTYQEFKGRIKLRGVFCDGYKNGNDDFGHGTHVAGIIAETTYGVAKLANIINIRIGDKFGGIADSAIIKGVNYVINAYKKDKNKNSIINMSFGGHYSETIAKLVKECTDNGIHIVASAGNELSDACTVTPSAAPSAITVADSDKSDQMYDSLNYRLCVDIYAPDVKITSAFKGSDNDSVALSGTSMSAPYVVDTVVLYISTYGNFIH
ncbi:1164_t:CDS:2 [Dentiscutata erythropus]|uniref:1164_t:CDS:1 n=1 Tax=Dentiscutata erythropus TaxID=1348616 RepID=A0A9N9IET6_9GLOM|nr:1164_t:CDS:2 [Dentiscutata erythropus]